MSQTDQTTPVSAIDEPRRKGVTVADFPLPESELRKYHGWCLELVDELLHQHPTGNILYVENLPIFHQWKYHAALVLDGLVYDAWHPDVRLPPAEYDAGVEEVRAKLGDIAEGASIYRDDCDGINVVWLGSQPSPTDQRVARRRVGWDRSRWIEGVGLYVEGVPGVE